MWLRAIVLVERHFRRLLTLSFTMPCREARVRAVESASWGQHLVVRSTYGGPSRPETLGTMS